MAQTCFIIAEPTPSARIRYGIAGVVAALREAGIEVVDAADATEVAEEACEQATVRILVGARAASAAIQRLEDDEVLLYNTGEPGEDGYYLSMVPGRTLVVTGGNETGVLYGCQELTKIIGREGSIPLDLDRGETPDMVLRGPAIGLQKTTVEPPRQVYEYPITADRFPWFYDRELWTDILDELFEQRANIIYLWSGHPFSSFVHLDDFPEAQEVTDDELVANRDVLLWLVAEADRRGIWIVIKFYNIHIPLPFAEHHGIPLRQPHPTPLTSAYTRATVAEFVANYPNVGLYVCLGEVLQGDLYGREWFIDTILAGVRDGVDAAQLAELPPVILRSHGIDPEEIVPAARAIYPRLFTEAKYNGESLTTWNPRGPWQEQHQFLASLDSTHIANVHILANLEPFRYGAVSFIQRSVQAMRHRLNATGLHLYPLFYWDWPYSPDRTQPRLRQIDRDWIWYAAWHRYAWKADRDPAAERQFWTEQLSRRYGDERAGTAALDAYEAMGQIAPRLIRRIGITEGNRQTFSLGMTLSQLTNPGRHRPWPDLWESHAPNGERLETYVDRLVSGEPHVGETPIDVITDARHFARVATDAITAGRGHVETNADDYERLAADVQALAEIAEFYANRVLAAIDILTYRHLTVTRPVRETLAQRDIRPHLHHLHRAVDRVADSLEHYRRLTKITTSTYVYANSMRTPQRRVPFKDGARCGHWSQCLPEYESELENLRRNVDHLARRTPAPDGSSRGVSDDQLRIGSFEPAEMSISAEGAEPFSLHVGSTAFSDATSTIWQVAPELDGLQGVRISKAQADGASFRLEIDLAAPAHVLIGYFQSSDPQWLQVPNLETNTHADDRGGLESVLYDAIGIHNHPSVNVHAFRYEAGRHVINLGPGAYLVAGAVSVNQTFTRRNAGQPVEDDLDWLYETPEATRDYDQGASSSTCNAE